MATTHQQAKADGAWALRRLGAQGLQVSARPAGQAREGESVQQAAHSLGMVAADEPAKIARGQGSGSVAPARPLGAGVPQEVAGCGAVAVPDVAMIRNRDSDTSKMSGLPVVKAVSQGRPHVWDVGSAGQGGRLLVPTPGPGAIQTGSPLVLPGRQAVVKHQPAPCPRLVGVDPDDYIRRSSGSPSAHDQAFGYCGLPSFPNLAIDLGGHEQLLTPEIALSVEFGDAACSVLSGQSPREYVVVQDTTVVIRVVDAKTPDGLERSAICVEFGAADASSSSNEAGRLRLHMWCTPTGALRKQWLVLSVTSYAGIQKAAAGSVVRQLFSGVLCLRINGSVGKRGSLRPGSYNAMPGASYATLLAMRNVWPPKPDGPIYPLQVLGAKWARAVQPGRGSGAVTVVGYRRLEGGFRIGRLRQVGPPGSVPVADVLHIGSDAGRVAICALRVLEGTGTWEYITIPSTWCTLTPEGFIDLGDRLLGDSRPTSPHSMLDAWGTLRVDGLSGVIGASSVIRPSIARALVTPGCTTHVYVPDTFGMCAMLAGLASQIGFDASVLCSGVGIHWMDRRYGMSGIIMVHYGNSTSPSWASLLDQAAPIRYDGVRLSTANQVHLPLCGELEGRYTLSDGFASAAQWLRTSPGRLGTMPSEAHEVCASFKSTTGLLAGCTVKCAVLTPVGCKTGLPVAHCVCLYYDGYLGGALSLVLPDAVMAIRCTDRPACKCHKLWASVKTTAHQLAPHAAWHLLSGYSGSGVNGMSVSSTRLRWLGEYEPLDYGLDVGVFSSRAGLGVGWAVSLGKLAVDAAVQELYVRLTR
jgi:hypothetical protein